MASILPIPQQFKDTWDELRTTLMGTPPSVMTGTDNLPGHILDAFSKMIYPSDPKEAFVGGVMNLMPGYIASNFRSPEQIQALRKLMAEEMRSRGPILHDISESGKLIPIEHIFPGADLFTAPKASLLKSDPIDQILRGSWYHGLSREARANLPLGEFIPGKGYYPPEDFLSVANQTGFPLSLHDSQSISNKLGEPAGISLSMLPTKSQQFSADEYIHRVLPQYGGSPTERIVNLMTKEGRGTLNDAYDVVANRVIENRMPLVAHDINTDRGILPQNFERLIANEGGVGWFNQGLSNELQQMGKRGILYNPQRWNEYEMLMLDPKYVLPLDYRKVGDYTKSVNVPKYETIGTPGTTPGMGKGLDQIKDLMSQNKSRLGDIYSERPWTQRLNEENKQTLLQMIDPQYREQVGNQLYSTKPYELDIPF